MFVLCIVKIENGGKWVDINKSSHNKHKNIRIHIEFSWKTKRNSLAILAKLSAAHLSFVLLLFDKGRFLHILRRLQIA